MPKNDCKHLDFARCVCTLDHVACGDGKHTALLIMECRGCGKAVPYPDDNFKLITPEAREWVISELKEKFQMELIPDY